MIRVGAQPEYQEFDRQVRQPGLAFLRRKSQPTSADFRKKNFWKKAIKHLHVAYSGSCAYTTMYLVDGGTIDHYLPKVAYPYLAYEWNNYRLARQKVNRRKGDTLNVVDPFEVQEGWFVLDVPSCLIRSGSGLKTEVRKRINATINILQLNADDSLVQERCDLLVDLADGNVTLEFLDRWYPFLSQEVRRQDIGNDLPVIFSRTDVIE